MDEWVDVLDENGAFTGERILKSEAHKNGIFHPTVHIWYYTKNGKILIQQRGKHKSTFPLRWDVSVAGHVMAGEDILDAAIREIKEEIGLDERVENLQKIGVFKSTQIHHATLKDHEYHHTYLCCLKKPFSQLVMQKSEINDLKLIPLIQFSEEVWGLANSKKYVPHQSSYYAAIIKSIQQRLENR